MTKKKTEAVETVHPYEALLMNWWVRATVSLVLGIFLGILSNMMPAATWLETMFILLSFGFAIALPLTCIIMALKEERTEKHGSRY